MIIKIVTHYYCHDCSFQHCYLIFYFLSFTKVHQCISKAITRLIIVSKELYILFSQISGLADWGRRGHNWREQDADPSIHSESACKLPNHDNSRHK